LDAFWETLIEDDRRRSYVYKLAAECFSHLGYASLNQFVLKDRFSKLPWEDVVKSGVVVRSSLWYTRNGCNCPYRHSNKDWKPIVFPQWLDDVIADLEN
jgi:hypothetical protein